MAAASLAVSIHGLSVRYGAIQALSGIDLRLAPGMALGIIGPNGSGKSTLLKAIAGLVPIETGTIDVFGARAGHLAPGTIGYVPQIEDVDWSFPVSVRDVVAMGRYPRMRAFSRLSAADRSSIGDAIDALDLGRLAHRHIAELSGGQRQRAFVARALAQEPTLLLLDEPTTGVDALTEEALREIVRHRVAAGMPVIMTTHDLDSAPLWFDRLAIVNKTLLLEGTPDDVLASGAYHAMREHTHMHGHVPA